MDRQGQFDHDYEQNDAAVEAPPQIGTDERRMHVRAYNYWVSLLDGRAYPSIEDLEPDNDDFGTNSVLLDFSSGADNPAISFLGDKLRAECDLADDIGSIADVPPRSLLSRLTDHYLQIIANRAPIGFEAEFVNHRGNNAMYRGILMPFSSDDDTIDFIYGVINWKEVVDAATATGLVDEVERAMQALSPRPTTPVPVWADGPSAQAELEEDELVLGEEEVLASYEPDGSEGLGDWLAVARDMAETAKAAEGRSRVALYNAIGQAYDFALVAEEQPDDYVDLLAESGLTYQERAPMTPIVKLVFGVDYDKTRLAEYASALSFAKRSGIPRGELSLVLQKFNGGLKAFVRADRTERNPDVSLEAKPESRAAKRARKMETKAIINIASEEEFVVLIARRVDESHVAVLGKADHDSGLVERALRRLNG